MALPHRRRLAAMQRRNYQLHGSEQELEQAPDPLEEDPALLSAIECRALVATARRTLANVA
jgi:hypothetical protein